MGGAGMDWDAISAISDTVGTVAVIVTLAYLAIQLRMANKQRELDSYRDLLDRLDVACQLFSQSVERASIINRGRSSLTNLNDDERLIFEYVHYQLLNAIEAWYSQLMETSSQGVYRDQQLENIVAFVRSQLDYPGVRNFWLEVKPMYLPVQLLIDEALSINQRDLS